MIENKTHQFSRFYLNDNKFKFNELKESEFLIEEERISSQIKK